MVTQTNFDDLETLTYVLGGVAIGLAGLLLFCVIGAYYWIYRLQKQVNKIKPLANFKIQRPVLNRKTPTFDRRTDTTPREFASPSVYDINSNSNYTPNRPQSPVGDNGVFANDNFNFGNHFAPDRQPSHLHSAPTRTAFNSNNNNAFY